MTQKKLLYRCKSVFPFDLFPDTIEVDTQKITISYGLFFFSKQVVSLLVEDLVNIEVTTGLFFSSAQFEIRYFESNPRRISFLSRNAGLRLREIVTGLIQMNNNDQIDRKTMPAKKVLQHAQKVARSREAL